MPLSLYVDHHVPKAITVGLRLREVDVVAAYEDGANEFDDPKLLDRAHELQRVLFTQDDDLLSEAARRQRESIPFYGVIYAHQLQVSIGMCVAASRSFPSLAFDFKLWTSPKLRPPEGADRPCISRRSPSALLVMTLERDAIAIPQRRQKRISNHDTDWLLAQPPRVRHASPAASVISLGSFVVANLRQHGAKHVFVPRRADHDPRLNLSGADAIRRLLSDARPDVLIHLAARRRPVRLPRFAGSPHRGSLTTLAITRGVPGALRAIMA